MQKLVGAVISVVIILIIVLWVDKGVEGFKAKKKNRPSPPASAKPSVPPSTPAAVPPSTPPSPAVPPSIPSTSVVPPPSPPAVPPSPPAAPPSIPSTPPAPPSSETKKTQRNTEKAEFIEKLEGLKASLTQLSTELDKKTTEATTIQTNLNTDFLNITNQVNTQQASVLSAIDTAKTTATTDIMKSVDEVNKIEKIINRDVKEITEAKEEIKQIVNNVYLKADSVKTRETFVTLDEAYGNGGFISGLWTSNHTKTQGVDEGFDNINKGQPFTDADLFELTNTLSTNLKEFHKAYYEYASCYYGATQSCDDPTLNTKKTAFDTATTNLNAAINDAKDATSGMSANEHKMNTATATTRHNNLKVLSKEVENTRAELDTKMNELLKKQNGNELTKELTTVQYVTIGWSVLAASALYYIFTELSE